MMNDGQEDFFSAMPPAGDPRGKTGLLSRASAREDIASPPTFRSILFPSGREPASLDAAGQPPCFVDLNFDQVLNAIVAKRDEAVLRPIFHATFRDEAIIRYRQAVFADLEHPGIRALFQPFCEAMRTVRANLAYAGKIDQASHRNTVVLRGILVYCEALQALLSRLETMPLASAGLQGLRGYLAGYVRSPAVARLAAEASRLREMLREIGYGMLFQGDRVTVRAYADEPDYATIILERFSRFRETEGERHEAAYRVDDFGLNHVEAAILDFVARLFPRPFRALDAFTGEHAEFIDAIVAAFDREIAFYLAYLDFIAPLQHAGLEFCLPEVSATDKRTRVDGGFDIALAAKLVHEGRKVVTNDFFLDGAERMIVVSGPNQGGKTTFARMFGQLHVLAGLGCPVPARQARLFLPDRIYAHFEREEDITNLRGKLEDELVRLHATCATMTGDSLVILNEIFNSTSLDDQVFLSTRVLGQILTTDAIGVCVTFLDGLSTLNEKTVSMVSSVVPDDPAQRTFRVVRRPADGLAYAVSLAEKRGVTYAQLRERVQP
jgi:hypothetical protein